LKSFSDNDVFLIVIYTDFILKDAYFLLHEPGSSGKKREHNNPAATAPRIGAMRCSCCRTRSGEVNENVEVKEDDKADAAENSKLIRGEGERRDEKEEEEEEEEEEEKEEEKEEEEEEETIDDDEGEAPATYHNEYTAAGLKEEPALGTPISINGIIGIDRIFGEMRFTLSNSGRAMMKTLYRQTTTDSAKIL